MTLPKLTAALFMLLFASNATALDEYLPVNPKTLEVKGGLGYGAVTGGYDSEGNTFSNPFSSNATVAELQIKYGIVNGLDVGLHLTYAWASDPFDTTAGFSQPYIGLKYAVPNVGAGGLIIVDLPIGSEDIVGPDPAIAIQLGALHGGAVGPLNLLTNVRYSLNYEDYEGYKSGNVLDFTFKPEFAVSEKMGVYAIVDWRLQSESVLWFWNTNAGHLLTLRPGANIAINDMLSVETRVPFTVMGKSSAIFWGINVLGIYSFGL